MTDTIELTKEQKLKVMSLREDGMSREEAIAEVTGQPIVEHVDAKSKIPEMTEEKRQEFIDAGIMAESEPVEVVGGTIIDEQPPQAVVPAAPRRQTAITTQHSYTPEEIETIKNTVAKGANDSELAMFLHICKTYGLDPFLKEIYYSAQMKTMITSRDGYLKAAQRDPLFDGIQSMAVCENDEFGIDAANNTVTHTFAKGDRGQVIGAWAMVFKKGMRPVIAYADYNEYNKNNPIWKTYKSAMCCKVAEVFALKRQFGITGLVTQEEMGTEQ